MVPPTRRKGRQCAAARQAAAAAGHQGTLERATSPQLADPPIPCPAQPISPPSPSPASLAESSSGSGSGLKSNCPVIMEDSIDSMSDNGLDDDTPLKQVLELCSTLAGKGFQFSISVRIKNSFVFSLKSESSEPPQGERRSPSYFRRQERRKLLKRRQIPFRKILRNPVKHRVWMQRWRRQTGSARRFDDFGVKKDQKVSHNMILMSKYKGQHGGEKGKKIRARPSPPFSGNARKKTVFLIRDVP